MHEGSINAIARKIRIYQVLLVGQVGQALPIGQALPVGLTLSIGQALTVGHTFGQALSIRSKHIRFTKTKTSRPAQPNRLIIFTPSSMPYSIRSFPCLQANLLRPPSLLHQGSPIIVATGQAQIMVCRVGLAAASSCCPKDHPALEAHLLC
jgi:hypothetical protein